MRPRSPAILLAPGRLGPRFACSRYRRFFGLRTSLAVSSVALGRIEFVLRANLARHPTDYPFVSSCSPPCVAASQLLSTRGGKHRHRGTFTLRCTPPLKRTRGRVSPSAPSAMAETGRFGTLSAPRGALGETRTTNGVLGQHALTSAATGCWRFVPGLNYPR